MENGFNVINQKRSTQPSKEDWVDLLICFLINLDLDFQTIFPPNYWDHPQHQKADEHINDFRKIINQIDKPINEQVKIAFRKSLASAVMEIGGKQCFPQYPSHQSVPMEIVFPLAGGRGLWHVRDPRCKMVCQTLRQIILFSKQDPFAVSHDMNYRKACLSPSTFEGLNNAFIDFVIDQIGGIPKDIPHFEKHIRACLLLRSLFLFLYSFS